MPVTDPTLLHLLGTGFVGDEYASDGHHLRWAFDQRLGFPRRAFCVDRRPSSLRDKLGEQTQRREGLPRSRVELIRDDFVGGQISAAMPGAQVTIGQLGLRLERDPTIVDLHGGAGADPAAIAWVRLELSTLPGAHVIVEGVARGWGEDGVVGVVEGLDERRRWWLGLLEELKEVELRSVERERRGPTLEDRLNPDRRTADVDELALRSAIAKSDPALARGISAKGLKLARDALIERDLQIEDLDRHLAQPRPMSLILVGARIDLIRITGPGAWLSAVHWLPVSTFADDRGDWQQVACFPILTDEDRYRDENKDILAAATKELAFDLLTGPTRPNGAEPLDEPIVPPARAATNDELAERYLYPWIEVLEPWVRQVLADSSGGALHQSEIHTSGALDEISTPGGGNVAGMIGPRQDLDIEIYPMLLAASLSFQVARQLGLGCVLRDVDGERWDYRVRGWWLEEDLRSWPEALTRRVQELAQAVPDETPAQFSDRITDLIDALSERALALAAVNALIAAEGPIVEVHAHAFDVQLGNRPLFTSAAALSVDQLGAVAPPPSGGAQEGLGRLSWPLRPRAGTPHDIAVTVGATLARTSRGSGEPYDSVLNPRSEFGRAVSVVPVEDPLAPGGAGTTYFWDRHVPANIDLTYGVSESDPFGRWSPFTSADSRWDHIVPPPPPGVSATLEDSLLTARLAWPPAGHAGLPGASAMNLRVHLRRDLPVPPSDPSFGALVGDPAQWPHAARTAAGTAGPFDFPASTGAATSFSHDGMSVTVTPGPNGFSVAFQGIAMSPDATGRTRIYVGATAVDASGVASTAVGGPGMGEFVAEVAPLVPTLQLNPDPLLATFPDALDRSTRTFAFPSTAGTRYTLFRAGEYEVVAAAARAGASTASYDAATTPANRAAALKSLAVVAREAFAPGPIVAATGPTSTLTDTLPGGLRTLTVYTVGGRSPNGSASPWPTVPGAFAVVAVPQIQAPSAPVVVRGEWRQAVTVSADPEQQVPHVELTIAAPGIGTAPVVRYEVYRTIDPALAGDVRRMTPLHAISVPADTSLPPWTTAEVAGMQIAVVRWRDAALDDWVSYTYRVVARGASVPSAPGSVGTRSSASVPITVRTQAAAAPEPTAVAATLTPGPDAASTEVSVSFAAVLPPATAGPSRGIVRQLLPGGRRVGVASDVLDPTASTHMLTGYVLPVPSGEAVTVELSIIDPTGREGAAVTAVTGPMP